MHYRNGREAKKRSSNSPDPTGRSSAVGILYDAKPGNDYCNGLIAPITGGSIQGACMVDCSHMDDLVALLAEKGLDKRPQGK